MSSSAEATPGAHAPDHGHHEESFIKKYFWSTDHKIIGMQYLFTGMLMALLGGFTVYVFRMQLAFPGYAVPGWGRVSAADYNSAGHHPRLGHDLLGGDAGADRRARATTSSR